MAERGAAPAGGDTQSSPPGGSGAPPAGYYGLAARSWLTEVLAAPPEASKRDKAMSRTGATKPKEELSSPEKRGPEP